MYTTDLQCTIPALWCRVPSVQDEKVKEFTENTEELHGPNRGQRSHTADYQDNM